MNAEAKNLVKIIRYTPLIFVFFTCIIMIALMYEEKVIDLKNEKFFIEKQYIESEKERIQQTILTVHKYINNEKVEAQKNLKIELKHHIDNAYNIITNIYNKNKNTYNKKEIIQIMKNALETIRYDKGNGYFSIHTIEGINILQPINRTFEGTSVLNRKDIRGNYPVQDAVKIATNKNEGFMNWYYYKANDRSKEFKKIGIVKKFEPYDLIITTGIFIDEYEKKLQEDILFHLKHIKYKNNGFPFIINYDGDVILHQSKLILNHNVFDDKDFYQVHDFYQNLLSNKDDQEGRFITIKPTITHGEDTKNFKISYVKKFDDWQWFIGTGFNTKKAQEIINQRKDVLLLKYNLYIENILFYGILITIVLLFISFFIAKIIENKFLDYKRKQEELYNKELKTKSEFDNFFGLSINLQVISTVEGKVLQINEASKSMLGYEPNELINTSFMDLVHPDDIKNTIQEMSKLSNGGNVYFFENRYIHKDGSFIHLAWSATTNQEHNLIYATAQNTTNSKLLQLEKKEKEKMLYQQSKMAAMGEMIGNIAHQWRQPLSLITTASTGAKVQKELDCLTDTQFYNTMDTINNTAQYLSQTIDDFRGFFNPKDNIFKEHNISKIIEKTFKLIDSQFKTKDILIITNIDDHELSTIENELIQVLINILNNARDALLEKIENRLIFINIYKKGNTSYIEILDNAGGIKDTIIDRVFEPYFTTKEKTQGTGIGLYMSFDIIQNHLKGQISVSNEKYIYNDIEQKGAKFIIELNSFD